MTPPHPKMHLHTKFGIPISKNIGDMHQTQCSFQETGSEVKFKVTVTQLWYATLCHPKMHPHTKFEIPTSNNIRDMLRTRLLLKQVRGQGQGHSDPKIVRDTSPSQDVSTHQIWKSYLKEYRRYGPDTKVGRTD